MDKLNNYNILLNSSGEINIDNIVNKKEQRTSTLRANVVLSFALVGSMSINQVNAAQQYNLSNLDSSIELVSLEKGQQLSQQITEYSNDLLEKTYADKGVFIEKILSFKSLENSWDGYGALPLGVKCAKNTITLIDSFDALILNKLSDMHPNPNGTITLEWENINSEIVSLEIGKETFTYYVDFNSLDTKFYNKQIFSFENIQLLKKYISAI